MHVCTVKKDQHKKNSSNVFHIFFGGSVYFFSARVAVVVECCVRFLQRETIRMNMDFSFLEASMRYMTSDANLVRSFFDET